MKKKYVPPEIEIEVFPQENVIVCSPTWWGENPGEEEGDDGELIGGNSFSFDR